MAQIIKEGKPHPVTLRDLVAVYHLTAWKCGYLHVLSTPEELREGLAGLWGKQPDWLQSWAVRAAGRIMARHRADLREMKLL